MSVPISKPNTVSLSELKHDMMIPQNHDMMIPQKTYMKFSKKEFSKKSAKVIPHENVKVIPHKNVPVETMDQLAERIHEKALANIRKLESQRDSGPEIKMVNPNSVIFQNPTDGSHYLLPQLSYGLTQQTTNLTL